MPRANWQPFIAFILSLGLLIFGLACLLWAEESQRDAMRQMKTTRNGRRWRTLGWIAICAGIPLTIVFAKEWFDTWFI
jgi:H+/Cl- antiporter ClcA